MALTQNVHKLYRTSVDGYFYKLRPTSGQVTVLLEAQKAIRDCLRIALSSQYEVKPKFRVQGSWAYGTCNQPAHPNQEMDLDYGAYLPARVFSEERSSEEAKNYYKVASEALLGLCEDLGWILDTSKLTCLRINNVLPNAHIDVPLYAVPNDMFDSLEENHQIVLEKSSHSDEIGFAALNSGMESFDSVSLSEARAIDLSSIDMIHMAKKNGEWKASDCEKVREWFQKICLHYPNQGFQLRSMVRYLKGWRDYQWKSNGPTSILLMIVATQNYQYIAGRDDLAILHIAERLSNALVGSVYEAGIEGHENEDFNSSNSEQRVENATKATRLHQFLFQAINARYPQQSIDLLISSFGYRIPNNTDLVVTETDAGSINPLAAILAEAPQKAESSEILKPQIGG